MPVSGRADDVAMANDHGPHGVVLIEMIAVLALVAVVLGIGSWWNQRGPTAAAMAEVLARVVAVSRWSAVHDGSPRVLLASPLGEELSAVRGAFECDAPVSERRVVWSVPPRTIVGWPVMGLAFAPDGRPRRCDGSGVGNTTILIEGPRGDRAAVIVAALGRVRWERR